MLKKSQFYICSFYGNVFLFLKSAELFYPLLFAVENKKKLIEIVNFFSSLDLELYNYSIKYFHITFIGICSKKKNLVKLLLLITIYFLVFN